MCRQYNHIIISIVMLFISISVVSQKVQQLDSLIQVLHRTEKPSDKINILNQLSNYYKDLDRERAINFAKQALFIAESIHDKSILSKTQYQLASILDQKKDLPYATELLLEAEERFHHDKETLLLAKTKLLLGKQYQNSFQFHKSVEALLEAHDLFIGLELGEMQALTLNYLGGNYYDQNEYDKAYEYYDSSLKIYTKLKDQSGKGKLENNLGEVHRMKGERDKAMMHYRKAVKIQSSLGNNDYLSIAYNNMGNVYLEMNYIDSAQYFLEQSLQLGIKENIPDLISSAKISLGDLFIKESQYDSALTYLQSGYKLSQQSGNLVALRNASELLSKFYAHKSDFKKALKFEHQFKDLSDSISNINSLEESTQLEMKLIFDHERELHQLQVQSNNLKYFTLAAAIISLLIILILLYGRLQIITNHSKLRDKTLKLESEQLKDEIDYKNRELATNVMYMVKKNELINLMSEKLFRVKKTFKPSVESKIQEIILNLQSNVDRNIWNEFQERFREVHGDYYQKLIALYPNLTENDLKLCAFIKLNMSTKEIASITHQNPNTIDVYRTRLRKKMNLSNQEISLNNYLSTI